MAFRLRAADGADVEALDELERACFGDDEDSFSASQLKYLVTKANAETRLLVDESDELKGYGTLLFRRNEHRARLYSFCLHPEARGLGLGQRLLLALEMTALARDCDHLYLEVRADNREAIALYRRMGYEMQRWLDDYYHDGCAAWRMIRPLGQTAASDN
ncbi:GNAT family N-acetyltransferase [Kushneria aurantia]|uniref:GNAT family N-acetyltransferase n=1 Tax=Kushneria aurantia TaxID=504092 RepID=A0ABV6G2T5_9GAMM|nr:GNAT family N-acetyltransferase [Kushneria aurantia]